MKIVQGDAMEGKAASLHRGGSAKYAYLLDGDPASPVDNYSVVITTTPGRFSPRHRHNFEQFRFQLEGVANYGLTGKLKPGMLGYFPEGVHYGPQTQDEDESLTMLVVQFGGASGGGYAGRAAVLKAQAELRALGEFKNGAFHRKKKLFGKSKVDGFQAIWEHVNQRPLVYPKPRYDVPVLTHPENYEWVRVEGAPGVAQKIMGVFTECRSEAALIRLDAGASYTAEGNRDIYFTLSGAGKVQGEPLRRFTTVLLEKGERARFSASERTELLRLRLPNLAHLVARHGQPEKAVAAE
jgi:hypothetical protein